MSRRRWSLGVFLVALAALCSGNAFGQHPSQHPSSPERAGTIVTGRPAVLAGSAVVNFSELARREPPAGASLRPVRPRVLLEAEEPLEPIVPVSPEALITPPPFVPFAASPSPSSSFVGLGDIPMVDSSLIVIPPDCDGAVGPTKIMSGLNNNYRIFNKTDGSVVSTVGTATFWAGTGPGINTSLTDPRTVYDPYNNRWIVCMISDFLTANSSIEIGVSQSSDPSGGWFLFRTNVAMNSGSADFPILGFNKNWVVVTVNMHRNSNGLFQQGAALVLDYPRLRSGEFSGTLFTQAGNTHFCTAPCVTYSSSLDTLYLVTHINSANATYALDRISGTPSAPTYTSGGSLTRTGGGWAQPLGNILPQSAPSSGASACGSTPCPLDVFDARVRSAPVYRGGTIYYTQCVGLPASGLTHTGVQWTKIATPSGAFMDGGRLEDPAATASNGGKWYAFPHIAVNSVGDFMVGFTQCASNQHPAAGYAVHLAADAPGSIRDALIYHAGEDYYHKTFATTTSRNRWGDYSGAQVDPSDDRSLWVVDEYAKTRTGTDDGNTGSNSSRWGTWWANVAGPAPSVTIAAGPSHAEGNSGTTPFTFTVNLSHGYSLPVTVSYRTSDGTATVADNDYQAAISSITIPAGSSSGTLTVNVVGDTKPESNETFVVTLTAAQNGVIGSPASSTATILDDDRGPQVTVSSPNGGEDIPTGMHFTVSWSATDPSSPDPLAVDLYVSKDLGAHYAGVAQNQANTGTYDWVPADSVATNGGGAPADSALFKVVAHDANGKSGEDVSDAPFSISARRVGVELGSAPLAFSLSSVGPIPAAGPVRIEYTVGRPAPVRLSVVDLQGRTVAVVAEGVHPAGRYEALWNRRAEVPAGVYFVSYQAAGKSFSRRVFVTR